MNIPIPLFIMIAIAIISVTILIGQITFKIGYKKATVTSDANWEKLAEEKTKQSLNQQRAVIKGKISEQLAPYLPNFPFNSSECRFLGSPIDFIVFNGMDQGHVQNIYLIDVKTNQSKLSPLQNSIVQAINNNQVFWHTHQINLQDNPINTNSQDVMNQFNNMVNDPNINDIFSDPMQV